MILKLIIAILLGTLAGTFTGLIPGVHINLIALLIVSASSFLTPFFPPIALILFISSMAITHTFLDFVPSIFLGAPDEDTALSILPGHEFLLKGKAHEAVLLTLIGSSTGIILSLIIIPLFIFFLSFAYPFIEQMMGLILIWISIFMIYHEKNSKLIAIIIFLLGGFLGIASLNMNIAQPLLPLLTGLFGSSTLIYSISKKTKIPKQKIKKIKINKKELIKPLIATSLISPICSFLPGLGSSQASIIGSEIIGKLNRKQFLVLIGSVNTIVMSLSFLTLYLINKSRTGAANAISQITQMTPKILSLIFVSIIVSSLISIFLTIKISKFFAKNIYKINYSKLSVIILIFLTLIIDIFSGVLGFFVFVVSTILGLTCTYLKIRKSYLMSCLLIPTILYYLPF